MDYAATLEQALARIADAADLDALEKLRVELLGKQGSISGLLKTLGGMSPEERQTVGPQIQALREGATNALVVRGLGDHQSRAAASLLMAALWVEIYPDDFPLLGRLCRCGLWPRFDAAHHASLP